MPDDKSNHKSVLAAAMAANILMLIFGLAYHALAMQLQDPATSDSMPPDSLQGLPLEMADWRGEDVAMDEAIVRKTDTDAHLSRRYSRKDGAESVMLFIGYSLSRFDRTFHRPEICYPANGWTAVDDRSVGVPLDNGMELPCTLFRFSRGDIDTEQTTVLHYYVADGRPYANVSVITPRLWRLHGNVNYAARVLITASNQDLGSDSAEKIVLDFARESGPLIARLFEALEAERRSGDSRGDSEGR